MGEEGKYFVGSYDGEPFRLRLSKNFWPPETFNPKGGITIWKGDDPVEGKIIAQRANIDRRTKARGSGREGT